MEGSSREESSSEVLAATRRLHNEVIPKFARHLDRQKVSHFAFVEELHRAGINVRHIGTVLSHTRSPSSRSVVLTEMILRVMKYIIRKVGGCYHRASSFPVQSSLYSSNVLLCLFFLLKAFRDSVEFSTYPSKDALHEILVEYFNLLFLRNDQSAEFWNAPERTLRSQMHHQFQFVYGRAVVPKITPTSDIPSSSVSSSSSTSSSTHALDRFGVKQSAADADIRDEVDIKALFEKLQLALGFKITERARRSFEQGNGEYEFLVEDVERIQPVVKHSHLVDLATGVSLYFKAKARENWDYQSDVLLSLAVQSLVSALRSAPFDQAASFYLAQCYYQQMKRTNNDEEKLRSLLVDVLEKFSLAQKYGWHPYLCYRCMFKSNYLAAQRTQNDEYFQSAGALLCEMLDHSGDKKPEGLTFLKNLVEKAVAKQRTTLLDALHLALYCEPFKAMLQERFHSFILEGCAHIPLEKMKRVLQGKFEIMWLSFTQVRKTPAPRASLL
jgi:hypothetical protein